MRPLVAAIKFFFTHTVPRDWKTLRCVRIPKTRTLPTVLSEEKVWTLLAAIEQPHWHAFFLTLYTCGLRLSDARMLTPANIDADRQHIHVKQTKNSNERFVPIPHGTLNALRSYWRTHRNNDWLFPSRAQLTRIIHDAWASTRRKLVSLGYCSKFVVSTGHPRREIDEFAKLASASGECLQRKNQTPVVVNNSGLKQIRSARQPVSERSAQRALQRIVTALDWNIEGISPHTLRHSYATAMLDAGANLAALQQYLGHKNLQATEIYLHFTRDGDAKARKIVAEHMNGPRGAGS
jgi:integrase